MMQMYQPISAGGGMNRFNPNPDEGLFPAPPVEGWDNRLKRGDHQMDQTENAPGTLDQMPHLTPPSRQQPQLPNFRPRFR